MKNIIINNTRLLGFVALLGSALIFGACEREILEDLESQNKNFVGPSLCPENFEYSSAFTASTSSPNFMSGDVVNITAGMNQVVEWEVTITGTTTGAVKTYSGTSDTINVNWNGRADKGSIFFGSESCELSISVACQDVISSTLNVTATDFSNQGYLLSDFDTPGVVTSWYAYGTPKVGINAETTSPVSASPQGGEYWRLEGNSTALEWFFGGMGNNTPIDLSMTTNNADSIYCNLLINGNGTANSEALIVFREAGTFRTYRKHIDWQGWKMISFKLSDAVNLGNSVALSDPSAVDIFEMELGAFPEQTKIADVIFDFVLFTEGAPFYEE